MDDMIVYEPKSDALKALYWRSEILQVMYWLRGEGFGDLVDPALLQRFLGVDAEVGVRYLDKLVDEGYVISFGDRYMLSEEGAKEGAMEFVAAFEGMTKSAHGECSADCWCHNSPEEADACARERAEAMLDHQHDHHDHNH